MGGLTASLADAHRVYAEQMTFEIEAIFETSRYVSQRSCRRVSERAYYLLADWQGVVVEQAAMRAKPSLSPNKDNFGVILQPPVKTSFSVRRQHSAGHCWRKKQHLYRVEESASTLMEDIECTTIA